MKSRFFMLAVLVVAFAMMSSGLLTQASNSGSGDNNILGLEATAAATKAAAPGKGFLRIIHAASAGPVDIYLDNAAKAAVTKLAAGAATDFLPMTAKSYRVTVRDSSIKHDPADVSADLLISTNITVPADGSVTVVAAGSKADGNFDLLTFVTDRSATLGKARIEAYHAAPNVGAADILQDGAPIATKVAFGKGLDKPLNVDIDPKTPTTTTLSIAPTGKTIPLASIANVALKADTIYTVIAGYTTVTVNKVESSSVAIMVFTSKATEPNPKPVATAAATAVATKAAAATSAAATTAATAAATTKP